MKFVLGVIVGIVIVTVGVDGVCTMLKRGVNEVQSVAKEAAH